jgi:hypothetical protein
MHDMVNSTDFCKDQNKEDQMEKGNEHGEHARNSEQVGHGLQFTVYVNLRCDRILGSLECSCEHIEYGHLKGVFFFVGL